MADPKCIKLVQDVAGVSREEAKDIAEMLEEKAQRESASGVPVTAEMLSSYSRDVGDKMRLAAAQAKKHAAINIRVSDSIDAFRASFIEAAKAAGISTKKAYKESYMALLGQSHLQLPGARVGVAARRGALHNEILNAGFFNRLAQEPHILKLARKGEQVLMDDAVREMMELRPDGTPGITKNADAVFLAKAMAEYSELMRTRLNAAGASIGKLPGWTPQYHSADLIRKATNADPEAWVNAEVKRLDLDKTFPGMSEADIRKTLHEIEDKIVLGEDPKNVSAVEKGQYVGPRNLANSLGKHREFHYKDADAWLADAREFGGKNVFEAVVSHLESGVRKLSLMEILGPNPETMLSANIERIRREIAADTTMTRIEKEKALAGLKGDISKRRGPIGIMFAEVMGETRLVEDGKALSVAGNFLRASQTLAKLGGALLSSFSDLGTFAHAIRFRGADGNLLEGYTKSLASLVAGRGSDEVKEVNRMLGMAVDGIIDDMAMRANAQDAQIPGIISKSMEWYFKAMGLTWWTDVLRGGAARAVAGEMATHSGKAFGDLPETYRAWLGFHGVDASRWDVIRQCTMKGADGNEYVVPMRARNLSDSAIDAMNAQKIDEIRSGLRQAKKGGLTPEASKKFESILAEMRTRTRRDIETGLHSMIKDEVDFAVIGPGDRERAIALQGTRPGTIGGEAARFIAQFKMFPIAYTNRILRGGRYGRAGQGFDALGLGELIAGSIVLGYASMCAKDAVKGLKPRDPTMPATWLAALVQGGGAGIYGDFLFGKVNRFGGGLEETVLGPALGEVNRLHRLYADAKGGDADAGDAFRFVVGNMPLVNLWWLRAALDYSILFSIQEAVSPGTLSRRERRLAQENGQEYIVPPSTVVNR